MRGLGSWSQGNRQHVLDVVAGEGTVETGVYSGCSPHLVHHGGAGGRVVGDDEDAVWRDANELACSSVNQLGLGVKGDHVAAVVSPHAADACAWTAHGVTLLRSTTTDSPGFSAATSGLRNAHCA